MSTKKINLKTSISKINAKAKQNKKKSSTKLKLILADPHKYLIPTLSQQKLQEFCELVQSEIRKTNVPAKEYAKHFGISLGMSSCLRLVGNRSASYALISKSVKPKFILQQIACFARQRNSKTLVFSVTDLEELCNKLFGVKSTTLTITNSTSLVFTEWISGQISSHENKPTIAASSQVMCDSDTKTSPSYMFETAPVLLKKSNSGERVFVPRNVVTCSQEIIDNRIKRTGDYLSFSSQTTFSTKVTEQKRGRNSILNKFIKSSSRVSDTTDNCNKGQTKTHHTTEKLPKKDEFAISYAKLKTLALLSNKDKSKKLKNKKIG